MFNYINVTFPNSDVPPQRVYKFSLTQERFAHEVVVVSFRDWDARYTSIKPLTLVSAELRSTSGSRTFNGYVHSVNPVVSPGKQFVTMTLIGMSYWLKQSRQQVYQNVTAGDVIKRICDSARLAYSVDEDRTTARVYDQVAQAGHTDLELMVRLATQNGCTLRFENSTVYYEPIGAYFSKNKDYATRFVMRQTSDPAGSTLYSFNATISEALTHPDAYKAAVSVSGVNPDDTTAYSYTAAAPETNSRLINQSALFDGFATHVVAPNLSIAAKEAEAIERFNRYPYRAVASVIGSPKLKPDAPIYLDGIGPDYSGFWTVLKVEHVIVEEKRNVYRYITNLIVGADSLGEASGATVPLSAGSTKYFGAKAKEDNGLTIRPLVYGERNVSVEPTVSQSTASTPNQVTEEKSGLVSNRTLPDMNVLPKWVADYADVNGIKSDNDPRIPDSVRKKNKLGVYSD